MANAARIRILSVEDHPLLREGLARVLESQPDMELLAQARNGVEAIEYFRKLLPDVTLMDLRLPDMSGIDAMIAIRGEFPEAAILTLTTYERDDEMRRALAAGARSFLIKTMPASDMFAAIRQVHAGKKYIPMEIAAYLAEHLGEDALSQREMEVLQLLSMGTRNSDIGQRLYISTETVKAHMKHIMDKLGAKDRRQAIAFAVRRGIIEL